MKPNWYFPIPVTVRNATKKGLALRKEYGRGGTSVGLATAKYLASREYASGKKVAHIAKYFPRHAGDSLGQRDPPSNGWIAWLLWGGDAGRRWADRIVRGLKKEVPKFGE